MSFFENDAFNDAICTSSSVRRVADASTCVRSSASREADFAVASERAAASWAVWRRRENKMPKVAPIAAQMIATVAQM